MFSISCHNLYSEQCAASSLPVLGINRGTARSSEVDAHSHCPWCSSELSFLSPPNHANGSIPQLPKCYFSNPSLISSTPHQIFSTTNCTTSRCSCYSFSSPYMRRSPQHATTPINEPRFANSTPLAEYVANITAENPDVSIGSSDWLTIIGKGKTDTYVWPIPGTDGPKEVAIPYYFAR
jgi:hypothetical protein